MLIIGLLLNLIILLLKLSHKLFSIVSLWLSTLNICLAQIVVEWDCNQLYASSSTSFNSFTAPSCFYWYVALAAFQNKFLISTLRWFFLKLLYRWLQQILCSYCGQLSIKVCTNPYQEQKFITYIQLVFFFFFLNYEKKNKCM